MNEQDVTKLRGQVTAAGEREASLRASAEKLMTDMRASGADMTERDNFAKIDEAFKGADSARDEVLGLRTMLARAVEIAGNGAHSPAPVAPVSNDRSRASMVDRFRSSDGFKHAEGTVLRSMGRGVQIDPVEILNRDEAMGAFRMRTTFDNSTAIGGGLLVPDYTGHIVDQLIRRVRLLDVINVGSTDTDTVDWVQEQARTDAAAPTAYGTAVPESAYGFEHIQTTVKRIGHFVPATKGILMDAGQTQTLLNTRLVSGLQLKVESQAFSGDGTGQNLLGFSNATTPTGGQGGLNTVAKGSDTQLDAVHKAITAIRVASIMNIEPTCILISPADYEKVLLQKTSQGAYIYANPTAGNTPTLWGLLPVVTPLVADGAPWVGDFRDACTLWMRMGIQLSASDSHSTYFVEGRVALLAETRVAFATTRPLSITGITGF